MGSRYIHQKAQVGLRTHIGRNVEIREGVKIGADCYIDSGVICTGDATIGNDVTIRNYCVIARGTEIGDGCFLAPRVMFNNISADGQQKGGAKLGKNVFVGTNAVFMEGVSVCDNVRIGAMSLVTKDITENGTYIGIPAKRIK